MPKTKKITKENTAKSSQTDLQNKLVTLRESIRVIKFKAEGGKPKNVKEIANLRKEISRVMTEVNKK